NEADHEKEFIFLSLRKTEGMDLKKYRMDFGADFLQKYEKVIAKYLEGKYLEIESANIRLTPKAYFVSNEIFAEFV
ncbi:MAG: coproporphyrinogen III oxidase family protein, partial [Candidatus Cloacimonetes bacterium]|nr:coproporphyrinogen III oxidase family protein [Candidatus Cloacimonadota bacterium]